MQDKLWERIWSLKKECGRLNDVAVRKQGEVGKLEQRLAKEIEFEKQQADGRPEDFAATIAMADPSQKLNGAELVVGQAGGVPDDMVNNAAVFALKSSELVSSARGKANAAAGLSPRGSRTGFSSNLAASFRPTSPPEWRGEGGGAATRGGGGGIAASSEYEYDDNAAARHYLRDAPLMEHLSRQTEELRLATEVEQASAQTLNHMANRLRQDKQKMRMAVDARRKMMEHCVREIDTADRERKHALFSAESARDKKTERVAAAAAAAEEHQKHLELQREARDTAARELAKVNEEKEREKRELAARMEEEERRRVEAKAQKTFAGNVANAKNATEEAKMMTVLKMTGTTDPDKLLELWNNRDERAEATQNDKEMLEKMAAKKRKQVEEYAADLQNVKLGGVASSIGLREADNLDNKVYSETARAEKYRDKISEAMRLHATTSDGFQFLMSKVRKSIALHSDGRPGPGMTLAPALAAIDEGEDGDPGARDNTGKLSVSATAVKIDQDIAIGATTLDMLDKYDELMKTVLEPLGGAAAAEARQLPGDPKDDGEEGGAEGGGDSNMDFGPASNDPVASKRRLRRMYTEAPPSSAVSSSGRMSVTGRPDRGAGGGVTRPDLDGIASTAGCRASAGSRGSSAVGGRGRSSVMMRCDDSDNESEAGPPPLQRNAMKLAARARVSKAEKANARKARQSSNSTGGR